MKIYISGPITRTMDYMDRFAKAESEVMAAGFIPVNPAKVNAQLPEGLTHAEYMKTSIAMLDICDAIYMLEGWQESKGCNIEFEHAYQNGITIIFEKGKK